MKKNTKIVVAIACAVFPWMVSADGSWALMQQESLVTIQGGCSGNTIKIELFSKEESKDSAYKLEAKCSSGQFVFSQDFSKADVPEGNYIVAVDGEKSQNTVAVTKKTDAVSKKNNADLQAKQKTVIPESAENKFLGAFVTLQQTILDMRTWLSQTTYPNVLKKSMAVALDGLDVAVGKVSKLIMSGESTEVVADNNAKIAEPVATAVETQVPAENIPALTVSQTEKQTTISADSVSSADGLSVSVSDKSISEIVQ